MVYRLHRNIQEQNLFCEEGRHVFPLLLDLWEILTSTSQNPQWYLSHIRRPKHINLMHNDALNSSKVQGALSNQKEMSTGVSKKSKCSALGHQLALLTLSRVLIGLLLFCFPHKKGWVH